MIIYFSGTGNSLAIARRIAQTLDEPIMSLYDAAGVDLSNEKRIGLVYPTYWLDAPLAVKQLVPQLTISPDAYLFIVITCGAQTNNAIWSVRRVLKAKGCELDYCNKIRVPDSSAAAFGRNPNDQKWKFERFASRLDNILSDLKEQKHALHYSGMDPIGYWLNKGSLGVKSYRLTTPHVDADKCIGCGTCYKVCPQDNITITDGKATIHDNCTMCLGCAHLCPQQAIMIADHIIDKSQQYHHPDIKLKDLIRR